MCSLMQLPHITCSSLSYTCYIEWKKINSCTRDHKILSHKHEAGIYSIWLTNCSNILPMMITWVKYGDVILQRAAYTTYDSGLTFFFSHFRQHYCHKTPGGIFFFPPAAPTERLVRNSNPDAVRDAVSCS